MRRRAAPQSGHPTWADNAVLTWWETRVSSHRGQQIFGLGQLQAQGVAPQGLLPLHSEHLARYRLGPLIGVHHDLHGELHAAPSPH